MDRREFLRSAGGATAVAAGTGATTTPAAAQDDGGGGGGDGGGGGGGGGSETVTVGPGSELVFDPDDLSIAPGTTVVWEWDSDTHNIVVDSTPDGADWQGHESIEDSGFTYEHTFDTNGDYAYFCQPHRSAGMEASLTVTENPGGGQAGEKEPEEMGVPIRAHYVGIGALLAVMVSIVFTFFQLKYGESPHAKGGND